MSKIGKQPITLPKDVTVKQDGRVLVIHGPKGELKVNVLPHVKAEIAENTIQFSLEGSSKTSSANWGTVRAHTQNAIEGVLNGFQKELEIEGVGYRAAMEGKNLVLNIGYSHPVKVEPLEGITIAVEKNTIKVSGIDKYLVGQQSADIRALKKPEPYKGKGIHYKGEYIPRKAGKKVAGTTS